MKGTIKRICTAGLLTASLFIVGCGGGGGGGSGSGSNNLAQGCDQKQQVHNLMTDVYYWYQDVPDVDPANYDSPQALLDVMIQPEKDRGHVYSYLTTVAAENAFLSNAGYVGFGFSSYRDANGRLFIREVFPGEDNTGPAFVAGIVRGDEITHIDGVEVASMSNVQLNEALGPAEIGYEVAFTVAPVSGASYDVSVAKDELEAVVVGDVVHNLGAGADTTYIYFRSFVDPAFAELDAAFAAMKANNDTKLVLDLRYNGGGLVSVAEHLGGLIAGTDQTGEVIARLEFNNRYQSNNVSHLVRNLTNTVDVTDLAVITTDGTASASEMIVNGLKPFSDSIDVFTIGSTSYGKPVGQSRLVFCTTEILRAVTFRVVNKDGNSDYYTGFSPPETGGCNAEDDLTHQLGDPDEASLASALYRLENGSCDPVASPKAAREQAKRMSLQPEGNPMIRDGWDLLTGGAR